MADEHIVNATGEPIAGSNAATWYLVQYTADLKKREPRNVGVLLRTPGRFWLARFFGEQAQGKVNGYKLRSLHLHKDAYEAWIAYYRRKMEADNWADVERSQKHRAANFSTSLGGQIVGDKNTNWERHLTDLFDDLVGEEHAPTAPVSAADLLKARAAELFDRAHVAVQRDVQAPALFGAGLPAMQIHFDFTFVNGQKHLAEAVSLGGWAGKDRALAFNARAKAVSAAGGGSSFLALYDHAQIEPTHEELILAALEGVAHTIDMSEPEQAVETLREIAHHE